MSDTIAIAIVVAGDGLAASASFASAAPLALAGRGDVLDAAAWIPRDVADPHVVVVISGPFATPPAVVDPHAAVLYIQDLTSIVEEPAPAAALDPTGEVQAFDFLTLAAILPTTEPESSNAPAAADPYGEAIGFSFDDLASAPEAAADAASPADSPNAADALAEVTAFDLATLAALE